MAEAFGIIGTIGVLFTTFEAINALKCLSGIRTDPQELELLLLELTSLTTTILPHEQRLSSDSEAPLQGISFLEPAVLDCYTKLEQALEVLKRCCDFTSKGGSRFKDRHKGWGWQEMKIVREQMDGVREFTERLRMEMVHKQIDDLREGMERLRKDLRSHTSKSPIPAEERVDYLFILQSDHQCNPITHSMRNTCTAIVSAPNRLNINISINKWFCDNSVKSTLNGDLLPILVTCLATLHKTEDQHREFFKHRLTTRNTTAHPRPVSDLTRLCPRDRSIGTCDGWKRHMKEHESLYPYNVCVASGRMRSYSRKINLLRHLEPRGFSNEASSTLADTWKPGADSESRTSPQDPAFPNSRALYIGAVKSNVGHGRAVAGATALIKVLLMLQKNSIPLHVKLCFTTRARVMSWVPLKLQPVRHIESDIAEHRASVAYDIKNFVNAALQERLRENRTSTWRPDS